MLKQGDLIRHKRFMDVVCVVMDCDANKMATVMWYNMGFVTGWFVPVKPERISVAGDWEICLHPEAKCLRYAEWENL